MASADQCACKQQQACRSWWWRAVEDGFAERKGMDGPMGGGCVVDRQAGEWGVCGVVDGGRVGECEWDGVGG